MTSPLRLFDRQLSAPKGCTRGTHRTREPAETLRVFKRLMPELGITRIGNITGLDRVGVPVCNAVRPNSREIAVTMGKGLTLDAARASALMESIEQWHVENLDLPLRLATFRDLRRREAVADLTRLPLVANGIPAADVGRDRLWVKGFDIIGQVATWVPFELLGLGLTDHLLPPGDLQPSTNGLASGNHLLEAITHALCEVIERDALAVWQQSDDMDGLDLASVDDRDCRAVLARLDAAGIRAFVWDVTSDVGVPTYQCIIIDAPEHHEGGRALRTAGSGTHLSPSIALLRALTEAVQTRLGFISCVRDDLSHSSTDFIFDRVLTRGAWDALTSVASERSFGGRADLSTDSFEGDIAVLTDAVRGVGVEQLVVVDLTRADCDVPVAFVVAPGLEGDPDFHRVGVRKARGAQR